MAVDLRGGCVPHGRTLSYFNDLQASLVPVLIPGITERITDDPDLVFVVIFYHVVKGPVDVPVDPQPCFGETVRVQVIHEKCVQDIAFKVVMDGSGERRVMGDDDVGPGLFEEAQMGQVQIVLSLKGSALDPDKVGKPSRLPNGVSS